MIETLKSAVNFLFSPTIYFNLMVLLLAGMVVFRRRIASVRFGVVFFGSEALLLLVSCLDPNFRLIITKPDNVPIAAMLFLIPFFTWYALRQAVLNDERTAEGKPVVEAERSEKIFVWPDLVYSELICLVVASFVLILWSVFLAAPLEEPASLTKSPNPSKAPWYFLGLQEMLVYFDPWLAGVVFPGLIIVGLMAIPYIDANKKGNGYYTFNQRKVEILLFLFGFLVLWCSLIVLGTFLRGPNWSFFGPFEYWDLHKLEPLVNVNLSEYLYVKWLGVALPGNWFLRELVGIVLVLAYFGLLPVILAKTWFKGFYGKMGPSRYAVGVFLFLMMFLLPVKMYLRWMFNLKYIVAIPEFFFNI
jgi:hypothetical protein